MKTMTDILQMPPNNLVFKAMKRLLEKARAAKYNADELEN